MLTYSESDILEAHTGGVPRSSLFGVAYPEVEVIETIEFTDSGLAKNYRAN